MASLTTFPLFPTLLPEIRDHIWALALPPARVMHVLPSTRATGNSTETQYTTSPASYGARHPVVLSVCRESRALARLKLTRRFDAYWNLEIDTLYVEVKKWGEDEAMGILADLRVRGLLEGFRHLALDHLIWRSSKPEHCTTSLRLLPAISTCAFIFKARDWHKDIINPGESWRLLSMDSPDQTEFVRHEQWCALVRWFEKRWKNYMESEFLKEKEEWKDRATHLQILQNVIGGRTMEKLPFSTNYYERPGEDFFG